MEQAAESLGASRVRRPSAGSSCPPCCRRSSPASASPSPARWASSARSCSSRGNLPFKTQVASVFIYAQVESDNVARRRRGVRGAPGDLLRGAARLRRRGPDGWCAMAGRLRAPRRSRWATWALLLALPVGLVFYRAFEHGIDTFWEAVTTPEAQHAFYLTLHDGGDRGAAEHRLRRALRARARARSTSAARRSQRRRRPAVRRVARWWSALALILRLRRATAGSATGSIDHGIQVIFSMPGMILATIFVSLPFVVREVVPVLREIGTEQEQAAATLGASPWQTFWRITLPAIRWGVAYGVVLTTARALGEFGALSIVSGKLSGRDRDADALRGEPLPALRSDGRLRRVRRLAGLALVVLLCHEPVQAQGGSLMGSRSENVSKRYGDFAALDDVSLDRPRRLAHRAARPERRRQVHAAAGRSPGSRSPTTGASSSTARTPPACPPASATWASCSSTTPPSST